MTDKVKSAIYFFDIDKNRKGRINLQNFLKRVNHLGTIVSQEFLVPISPLVNYDQRTMSDSDE